MNLRSLPSVEQLLQTRAARELVAAYGRRPTLDAIRAALEGARAPLKPRPGSLPAQSPGRRLNGRGESDELRAALPGREDLLERAGEWLKVRAAGALQPVINASGVILHTNLGRAPLSSAAIEAMRAASQGYSNLEFDLASGKRSSRQVHTQALLQQLTGAPAALVVNNNAAALLLVLSSLAARKRVVIARSQLVEIGGGFRMPDVMKQSGARLAEVGTTNKVHLADYEEALSEPAALVLRAHRSNFKIVGFTEEPALGEIAALAGRFQVPLVDDLGSGALLDTARYGLAHEPTVQESLAAGADLVCFSADKLLGGPQAGIIVGSRELIERIQRHPLARALRLDKTRLAGLAATLLHYLREEAEDEIPVWRMIARSPEQLRLAAEGWAARLGQGEVLPGESTVGGGSLPGETLPTFVLALTVRSPIRTLERLRRQDQPVVARTEHDRVVLDPRTVAPSEEAALLAGLRKVLAGPD
jgi:L-seryl-tRNA(Ser) seleniumtransferase